MKGFRGLGVSGLGFRVLGVGVRLWVSGLRLHEVNTGINSGSIKG